MHAALGAGMSLLRLCSLSFVIAAACTTPDSAPPSGPDPMPVPIDPAGDFLVHSTLSLPGPPASTAPVLAELHAATDGPDDPSRYLIELVVARLPAGNIKTAAQALTPYVAAYVNGRLATVAPRFLDGIRELTAGLERIAQRFGTLETVTIDEDGRMERTLEGFRFEAIEVAFDAIGLPDITVDTQVVLDGDRLAVANHVVPLPYARMLRLGLDRAAIPRVVPQCSDLACALRELVDCPQLGELIAERIGLGSPGLYAQACSIGLTASASAIYDRLPAFDSAPLHLQTTGTARAADHDRDGPMDAIEAGTWTGMLDGRPLGSASFAGVAR
jgi:hypothetical protein